MNNPKLFETDKSNEHSWELTTDITLRDLFAMHAMTGDWSASHGSSVVSQLGHLKAAKAYYEMADVMLEAREIATVQSDKPDPSQVDEYEVN